MTARNLPARPVGTAPVPDPPGPSSRFHIPARTWVSLAAIGVVRALATVVAAVIAVGLSLSAPKPATVGAPPSDLAAEDVTIPSASGATLSGWFVKGQPGSGVVVLMHGMWGSRIGMVRRAQLLNAAGFSVLLFDFQAHGESPGRHITFGLLESLDARAAVAYVRQRLPGERVGAIGDSGGGAAALLGPTPLAVDALVLEGVYADIGAAIANRARSVRPWAPSLPGPGRGYSSCCCRPFSASARPIFVRSITSAK
jgi:uncharacterized protein